MNIFQPLCLLLLSSILASCSSSNVKHMSTTNIGILMPITGQNAKIGQRLASMIEIGLEDALEGNIKVITYDIAEESRIPVIVNKMKARGTMLVLGPIFSANAQAIIPQIAPHSITMMTLSNNPSLASHNPHDSGVYVFGHAPMKQTQRIVSYMLSQGYKDYIMLLPASKFAREVVTVVGNMVQEKDAKLVQSEFYTDQPESIEVAVQNIANIVHHINELDDSSMKPVLYISDDTTLLRDVVAAIKRHNLDIQTVIVGDDKLDVEYDQPLTFLFTGSMQAQNDPALAKAKTLLAVRHFNYLDLIAYDLGKITAQTLGHGLTRDQFLARLNSGHIYIGASGAIKFDSGIAHRAYDIIKFDSGTYSLVEEGR